MWSTFAISLFSNVIFLLSYVSQTNSFKKPLTAKEEKEYLLKCKSGDLKARDILIERNLRLVAHIVKKYTSQGIDNDDLISIGTIGLIKAISTFDVQKGARLATYASKCIENEILMSFRADKKRKNDISLSDPVGKDKEGNEVTLIDKLYDDDSEIFEKVNLKMHVVKLYEKIKSVLTKRERNVLIMRYGIGGNKVYTQNEVAKKLGISRSYVSRIEKKAVEKLSESFKEE
ncbi:MAG: RNA polymerase sporulation sigma factor SigK [Ruminococcaceae bacterium]|nr:RNA polymerase sporulation sigma factor SigK [Oscillospiraceae bacterium]